MQGYRLIYRPCNVSPVSANSCGDFFVPNTYQIRLKVLNRALRSIKHYNGLDVKRQLIIKQFKQQKAPVGNDG